MGCGLVARLGAGGDLDVPQGRVDRRCMTMRSVTETTVMSIGLPSSKRKLTQDWSSVVMVHRCQPGLGQAVLERTLRSHSADPQTPEVTRDRSY